MYEEYQHNDAFASGIRRVVDSFESAYKAGDATGIASLFTESAVLLTPNEPPLQGIDTIRSRFESFFSGFHYRIEFAPTQTDLLHDVGFERGTYSAWAVLKEGGEPRGGSGEYMLLLQHQSEGGWLISAFGTAAPGTGMPNNEEWYTRLREVESDPTRAA